MVDLAESLNKAGGEIKKEGKIDLSNIREGMNGVFGVSIKSAVGGETIVEPFGNIHKTPKGPKVDEEREPIVDVFDEDNEVKIYAEMPGVDKKDIKIKVTGDILEISAKTAKRNYHKEILLKFAPPKENVAFNYTNGILELIVKK